VCVCVCVCVYLYIERDIYEQIQVGKYSQRTTVFIQVIII